MRFSTSPSIFVTVLTITGFTNGQAGNGSPDISSITNEQVPVQGLPATKWAWSGQEFSVFDDAYQFDKKILIMLTDRKNTKNVLWDPLTGLGTAMSPVQSESFFETYRMSRVAWWQRPQRLTPTQVLQESSGPGTTFSCHPIISTVYNVETERKIQSYCFIVEVKNPKTQQLHVCSEGELPGRETVRVRFDSTSMIFVPLPTGVTLAFPLGNAQCFIKLDQNFLQRVYAPGCPVQLKADSINSSFIRPGAGSPVYRQQVVAPLFEDAVRVRLRIPHWCASRRSRRLPIATWIMACETSRRAS